MTTKLVGPIQRSSTGVTLEYTAPAASAAFTKAVIRGITLTGITQATVQILLGSNAIAVAVVPANATVQFNYPDLAVEPGETIQSIAAGGAVVITVEGANIIPVS